MEKLKGGNGNEYKIDEGKNSIEKIIEIDIIDKIIKELDDIIYDSKIMRHDSRKIEAMKTKEVWIKIKKK